MKFRVYSVNMEKTNGLDFFLREDVIIGIIKIENMLTGNFLLVKSLDCIADSRKIRFSLDLGTYTQSALQKDYEATGLELFDISIAAEAKKKEDLDEIFETTRILLEKKGKKSY